MIHPDSPAEPSGFFFRGLHPGFYIGTMSDRYAGWIGQVYSRERWTWLPSLRHQIDLAGGWFDGGDGSRIIRLITPRGRTYQQTYAAAHPFTETVPGMLSDAVVEETVEIIRGVVRKGSRLSLFINNRAGGNAPLAARKIAREFLDRSS